MDREHLPPPGPSAPPAADAELVPEAAQLSQAAVERLAASAARGVDGVSSLGTGAGRAFGALRGRVAGQHEDPAVGVTAEVGREEVAVDLTLIAEYGRPLHDVAADVRAAVFSAVGDITGLRVIEVNVDISDVHLRAAEETTPAITAEPAAATPPATEPPTHRPLEGDRA
ncbi:Asp23/Gls24 family envelope stress response protein [Zhihengliuella flava]|uniref:Alkaline shock family protein YloU n=1 Tax=Zhihengliuella flava TaxID=1285193 RepID=A0A931D9H5_9MICC|nr:Asp23/Gls24 family envelope stress response protein [Zhihengliuella flava]MBG6084892.1 putative alkaline shock family protein YloU [Zhihengliuella flava]